MGCIDFINVFTIWGKKAKNFSIVYKKKIQIFFFTGVVEKKIFKKKT